MFRRAEPFIVLFIIAVFVVGISLHHVFGQTKNLVNPGTPGIEICTLSATQSGLGAADTNLVNLVTNKNIYVCDVEVSTGAAVQTVQLESSAANACTSPTVFGTLWNMGINTIKPGTNSYWRGQSTGASNALCVHTVGTGPSSVTVFYDQY